MTERRLAKESVFGLTLGALVIVALSFLIPAWAGRIDRAFHRPSAKAPLASSPPKPAAMTSTVPAIPPEYDEDSAMTPRAESVVDYTLRASLDPISHTVRGEGTILFRNSSRASLSELWFHLYLNAFKNERTLFLRKPGLSLRKSETTEFGHIEVEELVAPRFGDENLWAKADRHSPNDEEDETDIRVPLPSPLEPGESLSLHIRFTAKLPRVMARTGHAGSFHMVAQWFPKLARLEADGTFAHFPFHPLSEFYADFGKYDVTIEVPEGFVVGATGPRIESIREGGKLRVRHVQESVHDFAFAAWDGFREERALEDGIAIHCLYPEGYERAAKRQIEAAKFGLRRFGEAFGRYPYSVLTLVHPPAFAEEAGGMEYPTLITTGGPPLQPDGLRAIEHLTLHELGHQYFYGLIATNEHHWPFLDEGINSFVESVFLPELLGKGSFVDGFGITLGVAEGHRYFGIDRGHRAPVAQPARDFEHAADYASLVYSRTATIFQTFSRVYGQENVMRALGRYARRYRFEHPGVEELIAAMRDVLGEGAEANLRRALLERGFIDYAVTEANSELRADGRFEGFAVVNRYGTLAFPVEVELLSQDGEVERILWDGEDHSLRIPYAGSSPLSSVTVDPESRVFLDENLFNNSIAIDNPRLSTTILERLGYLAALLVHGAMP